MQAVYAATNLVRNSFQTILSIKSAILLRGVPTDCYQVRNAQDDLGMSFNHGTNSVASLSILGHGG
jgi:hypothetical protein